MRSLGRLLSCSFALALAGLAPAGADTFAIGSHVPLTGNLARVGKGMDEGIAVAVALANEDSKGKHSFELRRIDDETSPAKAVAAVERLAAEGVVAFTGGYGSNIIGPASEAADKAGKVYVTSGGVSPGLTKRGLKTFFRINNEDGYGRAMVGLLRDLGVKKVAVVYLNKEATVSIARYVERELKGAGVEVAMAEFDESTKDFKPVINRVKLRDRSEAVAMVGYENDYVGILRAAAVLKPDVKAMVGVWSLATSQMNGEFNDLMQNVYGTALLPYPVAFQGEEAKRFGETYQRLHGKEPDYLGQFGYVQTKLLIEAILRAHDKGVLKTGGLSDELRAAKGETLIGEVAFDPAGDNPNFAHRMGQHQGKRVEIVWPTATATGKMNFPGVSW